MEPDPQSAEMAPRMFFVTGVQMEIAQNVAGQIQELSQISCILQIGLNFLVFCCILILAIKTDLHFFYIFLRPDF